MAYSSEIAIIAILKILFVSLGCWVIIARINPKLKELIYATIEDKPATEAFIYLLNIFVIVITGILAISFLSIIPSKAIPYLITLSPAFQIIQSLFDYIKWILTVLIGIFAFKFISKR